MNLKKLMDKINSLADQIQNLVDSEKFDEAAELRAQYDAAVEQYNTLKDMDLQHMQGAGAPAQDPVDEEKKKFFNAYRAGFKNIMTEGVDADGGYTVPQDIQTKINRYKETHRSLRDLVTVENVTTDKGSRVYETKSDVSGFQKVDENGLLPALDEPKFTQINYSIDDYGGYLPVTNDLLRDSDANIEAEVTNWVGKNSLKTDNNEILTILKTGTVVAVSSIDDIIKAIVSTIGSAYDSKIVTNDDGIVWLSTLKDTNKRPLLNPDPTAPAQLQLRCGAKVVPVEQFPNSDMPSTTSGDNTVIPLFMGELAEAVRVYDRQQTMMFGSDVAAVTNSEGKVVYNAFQQRGKLYRADARMDYQKIDGSAFLYGQITL